VTATPDGIVLRRHLYLEQRAWQLSFRRAVIALLAVVTLAALLGAFGQEPATTSARSARATLTVASPDRVRGGLMFTTAFTIEARQPIDHPVLVLDGGWFDGMQVNSIVPQPKDETSVGGRTVLTLERVPAGGRQVYYIGFQVNPTTLGRKTQDVRLRDGSRTLLAIKRTFTVLP
jgi:hypothetical protein